MIELDERCLGSLVLRVVLENWNRAGHHWRGASAWNRANIIGEVRV